MIAAIHPYRPTDREAVHQLAGDTAFFGDPVETFLPDRKAFSDAFVAYYTDREPGLIWVAEADGTVVGYLMAGADGRGVGLGQVRVALAAVGRLLAGRYHLGRSGWTFVGRLALSVLRGEQPRANLCPYPAHLHINVAEPYRGLGLGRRLLAACLGQMAELGVPGVHLNTTNRNEAAVVLYEKMGFCRLASRCTHLWEPWLPGAEVWNLLYGKQIL